jgi:hypothetical protein
VTETETRGNFFESSIGQVEKNSLQYQAIKIIVGAILKCEKGQSWQELKVT